MDLHVWMGEGKCLRPPHEDCDGPWEFIVDVYDEEDHAGMAMYEEHVGLWETDPCAYHRHELIVIGKSG